MSCCGNKREQYHGTGGSAGSFRTANPGNGGPSQMEKRRYTVAYFQYTGGTGLTVIGPRTGKRYRFERNGSVVAVDLGDRLSLAAVPNLRQVTNPG